MDTRTVVDLAGKAIEGVLVFRGSAFKSKAFYDIKNIRTAAGSAIRALCKQRAYSGEIPLVNVVEVVGNAVSSAAEKWNKIADPKNHIDRDWLRHCVCDLVGGAVTHAAFEEIKWLNSEAMEEEEEDDEYLDPTGEDYEDISDDSFDTVIHRPAFTPSNGDHAYYSLQQSHFGTEHDSLEHNETLLPRHQINQHWAALKNAEVDASTWATANDRTSAAISPDEYGSTSHTVAHKRPAPRSASDDDEKSELQTIQPKRRRNINRAPTTPVPNEALQGEEEEDDKELGAAEVSKQQRKVSSKMPWTPAESDRLKTSRDSGKSWDEVHMSFSNRTKAAIMHKYRLLTSRTTAEEEEDGGASVQQGRK